MVAQAISNMIENAVKYGDPHTTIRISAYVGGDQVGTVVESYGIPIAEEDKKHIFDRGFRGNSARQKVPAGTGIGLYLASRVMAFHGGHIEVVTNGRRTGFALLFPRDQVGDEYLMHTILFVDDEPSSTQALRMLLEARGFRCVSRTDVNVWHLPFFARKLSLCWSLT